MMNNSKLEELLNTARINELLHKKELEEKNKNGILVALAIVGAIATVAAIAYAVYRYFTPDYLDDFDDDYEDEGGSKLPIIILAIAIVIVGALIAYMLLFR